MDAQKRSYTGGDGLRRGLLQNGRDHPGRGKTCRQRMSANLMMGEHKILTIQSHWKYS
jgi:hypothetical protein